MDGMAAKTLYAGNLDAFGPVRKSNVTGLHKVADVDAPVFHKDDDKKSAENIYLKRDDLASYELRRKLAQKQAMSVVRNAFNNEQKYANGVKNLRDKLHYISSLDMDASAQIKGNNEYKDKLLNSGENAPFIKAEIEELELANKRYINSKEVYRSIVEKVTTDLGELEVKKLGCQPMLEAKRAADMLMNTAARIIMTQIIAQAEDNREQEQKEDKKEVRESDAKARLEISKAGEEVKESALKARRQAIINKKYQESDVPDPDDATDLEKEMKNESRADDIDKVQAEITAKIEEVAEQIKVLMDDIKGAVIDDSI